MIWRERRKGKNQRRSRVGLWKKASTHVQDVPLKLRSNSKKESGLLHALDDPSHLSRLRSPVPFGRTGSSIDEPLKREGKKGVRKEERVARREAENAHLLDGRCFREKLADENQLS